MVHPLSIVCRSVVWFAVLLVSSDGRVAGFGEVQRVLCGMVFLTRRSVTVRSAKKGRGKGKGKEKAVQEAQEVQGPDSPAPSAYNPPWGTISEHIWLHDGGRRGGHVKEGYECPTYMGVPLSTGPLSNELGVESSIT